MQRFNVLDDGPFRYIHSTETGELFSTLVKERNSNLRETGKFVEEEGEEPPVGRTLRQWKAILARRWDARTNRRQQLAARFAGRRPSESSFIDDAPTISINEK